jgi:hypothetical protein
MAVPLLEVGELEAEVGELTFESFVLRIEVRVANGGQVFGRLQEATARGVMFDDMHDGFLFIEGRA